MIKVGRIHGEIQPDLLWGGRPVLSVHQEVCGSQGGGKDGAEYWAGGILGPCCRLDKIGCQGKTRRIQGLAAVAVGWAPVGWSEGHAVSGGPAFTWNKAERTATSAWVKLCWLCMAGAAGCRVVDIVMSVDGGAQAW